MKKLHIGILLTLVAVLLCSIISLPADAQISNASTFSVSGLKITDDDSTSITWNVNGANAISVATGDFTGGTTKSSTLTISNTSGSEAVLSFDLAYFLKAGGKNAQSFIAIKGVNYAITDKAGRLSSEETGSSGLDNATTLTYTLKANETITIQVSATGGTVARGQAKLSITNINLKVKTTANIVFAPNATVPYNVGYVDGNGALQSASVASGGSNVTVEAELSEGFSITPTTEGYVCENATGTTSGTVFVGGNGKFIFAKDETVTPVFISSSEATPFTHLGVNKSYHTLGAAANAGSGTVVLNQEYTLPAGNYTIPYGVTLLIPFNTANDCYTTEPGTMTYDRDAGETFATYQPYAYRTLIMASGANITVEGAISVSAKHSATQGSNGSPIDAYGLISMNSGSNITIESGGALYAWGYITGSGSVVAKSGASVYENFQLTDWRGGNATSSIKDEVTTYRVFPFSQYYIQNIEVPLTLYAGATEYARMSVDVTLAGVNGSTVPFIGASGAMFSLNSGYVVKDYVEGTGRIKVDIYGDISVSPISVDIKLIAIGSYNLKSEEFVLPISGHMTVDIQSGNVSVEQDLALLPGCEFYLRKGANFTLGSGKSIYVYDSAEWGGYCYTSNSKYVKLNYVPGGNGITGRDKDAFIQVDGYADLSAGYAYTTASGANVYSSGTGVVKMAKGTQEVTYQVTQSGNAVGKWNPISITPAQLKNGDGTYTLTGSSSTSPNTFTYSNGKWVCESHTYDNDCDTSCNVCGTTRSITHSYVLTSDTATCTAAGTKTYTCSICKATKTEASSALGHDMKAGAVTAPTCTAGGYTTYACSRCSHTEQRDQTPAAGHTEVIDAAVAATCTATGLTEGTHCSVCNTVLVAQSVVPATGHSFTVEQSRTAATCMATGSVTLKCANCNETKTETLAINSGNHTGINHTENAKDPSCTAKGYTGDSVCECGATVAYGSDIPALEHSYESVVTDPTCTEDGYITYTCSSCGDSYTADEVAALGHSYDDGVVTTAPTCTDAGVKTYTCGACGDSYTEEIEATGHSYNAVVTPPTCTENGYTTYTCACGNGYVDNEVESNGHSYSSEVTTPATCTTDGVRTFTCTVCNDSYTEVIPAGHNYGANSVCSCGWFKFHAANVRLGNNLDMMFAFPKAGLPDSLEGYYVKLVRGGVELDPIPASLWKSTSVDGVPCYYITYSGFSAKEMCDTITVTVYRQSTNGEKDVAISDAREDSIQLYAKRMLDKATDALTLDSDKDGVADITTDTKRMKYYTTQRTLIVDMLNYGAACQKFFAYDTENLANAQIKDYLEYGTQTDPAAVNSSGSTNDYWVGSNVMADSNTQFVVGFSSEFKEGMYFTYEFKNHWGKTVFKKIYFEDISSIEKMYHGLANLRLADARISITFKVYDASGNALAEWTDSVESYCARMIATHPDNADVYKALLKFADSARAYLHYSEEEST